MEADANQRGKQKAKYSGFYTSTHMSTSTSLNKKECGAIGRVSARDPTLVQPATVFVLIYIYFMDLPCWTSTTNLMQGGAKERTVRYIWTNIIYIYMNASNNERSLKKPK